MPAVRPRCRPHAPRHASLPLRGPLDALDVILAAVDEPPEAQTVCLVLDDAHCGLTAIVVDGTTDDDAVLDLAGLVVQAGSGDQRRIGALVLASVRPLRSHLPTPADVERWTKLNAVVEGGGITLLDWFLVGADHIGSVAESLGAPWRWRTPEPCWTTGDPTWDQLDSPEATDL